TSPPAAPGSAAATVPVTAASAAAAAASLRGGGDKNGVGTGKGPTRGNGDALALTHLFMRSKEDSGCLQPAVRKEGPDDEGAENCDIFRPSPPPPPPTCQLVEGNEALGFGAPVTETVQGAR
ncbi:unnamed protein product, partial [Laminaria digitata]